MVEPISQDEFDQMWNSEPDKSVEIGIDTSIIGTVILHYADWCGWSKELLPHWEKFEEHAKTNLKMLKIDKIDYIKGDRPPSSIGIKACPTIIFYVNNKPCSKLEGGDKTYTDILNFCYLSALQNCSAIQENY